jgi:hypothetical protein
LNDKPISTNFLFVHLAPQSCLHQQNPHSCLYIWLN